MDESKKVAEKREIEKTVSIFMAVVESRLESHNHMGHWAILTPEQCLSKMREQVTEAEHAFHDMALGKNTNTLVLTKCADAAAYAMFLADNVHAIRKDLPDESVERT